MLRRFLEGTMVQVGVIAAGEVQAVLDDLRRYAGKPVIQFHVLGKVGETFVRACNRLGNVRAKPGTVRVPPLQSRTAFSCSMNACIQRIGKNKFRIIYDAPKKDGKRKQKTETLKHVTEREAKATLAKREEAIARDDYDHDTIALRGVFDKFLALLPKVEQRRNCSVIVRLLAISSV